MGTYADAPPTFLLADLQYGPPGHLMVKGLLVILLSHTWVKLTMQMRTDPVSAFNLAAGILQVVDISFRALSACREIQKNGVLAEHRDSRDITQRLLETTRHLEKTYSNVPASALKHSNDVIDVSKKCSETAAQVRFSIVSSSIHHCSTQRSAQR